MIYIGADHRGYPLKEKLKVFLDDQGVEYEDVGALTLDPNDDYPQYAKAVAEHMHEASDRGILICGSGVGVDAAANKFPGIRAGLAIDPQQIESARHDDDINVLALAADFLSDEEARDIVQAFLKTEFTPTTGHLRRLQEVSDIEEDF